MDLIAVEAIGAVEDYTATASIKEKRLALGVLEVLEDSGFLVAPQDRAVIKRDAGESGLPAPRLQLRWDGPGICHYELVMHLGEHDIRREVRDADGEMIMNSRFMALPLGCTRINGGDQKCAQYDPDLGVEVVRTPFRDGAHAAWDSYSLGIPAYAVFGDKATLIPPQAPRDA